MTIHDEFFNMLHEEHQQVMDMIKKMEAMSDREYTDREEMFNKLKSALVPHLRGEEKAFYSILRKNKESKMDAMEAMEEHHIAEVSMMELDKMSKEEEFWAPKLSVFKELISHHVKEEESKIFKDARDTISNDQMQEVIRNFQHEKESAKSKATSSRSTSRSSS